ncbi:hypothetical protein P3W85_43430 [Cupriavidus basilensis]|uniref:Uncharacterized protein n=1 Tax=Cupriavidus basilensis TaxID=68895 RepID=A0ABT6B562_9BURK|nr:hypothetical protein [Cupriavidus basilensis]MDF3839743.1 hypothetical protein [Cupriavidus basilensis]
MSRFSLRRGLLVLVLLPCFAPAFAGQPDAAGSIHATVTHAEGAAPPQGYLSQLASWRAARLVSNAQVLAARPGQDKPGFSTITLLDFRNEKAFTQWHEQASRQLGASARIRRADVVRKEGKQPIASAEPVYVVSFYDTLVPPAEYKVYTDRYIVPNMHSQQGFGVMGRYAMYLEREPGGAKGRSVLVMEYVDQSAFAQRDEVKKKGSKVLLADPQWKQYNDIKGTIRTHTSEAVASALKLN